MFARGRGRRAVGLLSGLVIGVACVATELVVRAPREPVAHPGGPLASLAPLSIRLPTPPLAAPGAPIGTREEGPGVRGGPIYLTEPPERVLHRLVATELRAAGHQVVAEGGDVTLEIHPGEFRVDDRRSGAAWTVVAHADMALRVSRRAGDKAFNEFLYAADRTGEAAWPSIGSMERVLAECLEDLARLVVQRDELARALELHAGRH